MSGAGVGSEGEIQVGVTGYRDAAVGVRAPAPFRGELPAVDADDGERGAGLGHLETGGEHDGVELVLDAFDGRIPLGDNRAMGQVTSLQLSACSAG